MYCKYCGVALSENAKFCGICGERVAGEEKTVPEPADNRETDGGESGVREAAVRESVSRAAGSRAGGVRVGYSERISDPAFARYVKNSNRWASIFSVILAVAAVVGFFIAGQMGVEGMGNPEALFIGMVIGGMFLLIGFFTVLGRKRSRTWDGVVADKKIRRRTRSVSDGDDARRVRYLEYKVTIRENGGKAHSITNKDNDTLYNYYKVGDRVRHHAGVNTFEKYDKSGDDIIFCSACSTLCDINDDYCPRCKCPLLK